MKVKKYVAASLPEALRLVREELGPDAVILNSRPVKPGGILRFFKKKKVEVIAAVDEVPPSPRNQHILMGREVKSSTGETPSREREDLLQEIAELKHLVHQLTNNNREESVFPAVFQPVLKRIAQHGVRIDFEKLAANVLPVYYRKGMTEQEAERAVRDYLVRELRTIPFAVRHEKKYLCLIGPTGVGKTTTLVKIASHFALERRENIAFITIDTYRIGAVEQLKTYAKILNVPVHVCYDREDFIRALEACAGYERVFIDTVGRNYFEAGHVKDLLHWFGDYRQIETYFVLSLTMKEEDGREVFSQFSALPIDGFIFTKLDETKTYGTLYNLPLAYQKPVAYITTGQEVPDDIVIARPEWIAGKLTGADAYD